MFFPLLRMEERILLLSDYVALCIVDHKIPSLFTSKGSYSCKIEINSTVKPLNAILNKEGNFDVPFVKESVQLLFDHAVVPTRKSACDLLEFTHAQHNQLCCRRPIQHHRMHCFEMFNCHMGDFLSLTALQHLVLKAHQH